MLRSFQDIETDLEEETHVQSESLYVIKSIPGQSSQEIITVSIFPLYR